MQNTSTGAKYMYMGYSSNSNLFFTNNKFTMSNTSSGVQYMYNIYSGNTGNIDYSNNTITMSSVTGTTYHFGAYSNTGSLGYLKANGNKVTINASSSASLYNYIGCYGYAVNKDVNEVNNNNVYMNSASGLAYNYLGYYNDGGTLMDNICEVRAGTAAYGMYNYGYSSGTKQWIIKNNKIIAVGGSSTVIGMYPSYCNNAEIANNSIYAKGNSTVYGLYQSYNSGGANVYNNTVYTEGTSTMYTVYCYQSSGTQFATYRNNVFARSGSTSGYLMYGYTPNFYDADYNNLYHNGASSYFGAVYANVTALRAGTGQHMNSL